VGIGRKKVLRTAVYVGEIAAAAAGNQNLFAQPIGVFENGGTLSALSRFNGAHQTCGAASENQHIERVGGGHHM